MTPIERACLYGIGILTGIITITRAVELWIDHLTVKYWERQKRNPGATTTTSATRRQGG